MRVLLCITLVAAALSGPALGSAKAQRSSDGDEAASAEELRDQGAVAAADGRWDEARERFEQSYALSQQNATLLDLANAQGRTDRLLAAIASYDRLLAGARRREAHLVRAARAARATVSARVPRIVLRIEGLRGGDEVWLDDEVLEHGELDTPRPVDPGEHTVTVARGGSPTAEESFEVAEGGDSEIVVDAVQAQPRAGDPRYAPDPSDQDGIDRGGGGLLASPWLWVGVGLVVAAAIAVPIVVVNQNAPAGETYMGSLGAGVLTFQ